MELINSKIEIPQIKIENNKYTIETETNKYVIESRWESDFKDSISNLIIYTDQESFNKNNY